MINVENLKELEGNVLVVKLNTSVSSEAIDAAKKIIDHKEGSNDVLRSTLNKLGFHVQIGETSINSTVIQTRTIVFSLFEKNKEGLIELKPVDEKIIQNFATVLEEYLNKVISSVDSETGERREAKIYEVVTLKEYYKSSNYIFFEFEKDDFKGIDMDELTKEMTNHEEFLDLSEEAGMSIISNSMITIIRLKGKKVSLSVLYKEEENVSQYTSKIIRIYKDTLEKTLLEEDILCTPKTIKGREGAIYKANRANPGLKGGSELGIAVSLNIPDCAIDKLDMIEGIKDIPEVDLPEEIKKDKTYSVVNFIENVLKLKNKEYEGLFFHEKWFNVKGLYDIVDKEGKFIDRNIEIRDSDDGFREIVVIASTNLPVKVKNEDDILGISLIKSAMLSEDIGVNEDLVEDLMRAADFVEEEIKEICGDVNYSTRKSSNKISEIIKKDLEQLGQQPESITRIANVIPKFKYQKVGLTLIQLANIINGSDKSVRLILDVGNEGKDSIVRVPTVTNRKIHPLELEFTGYSYAAVVTAAKILLSAEEKSEEGLFEDLSNKVANAILLLKVSNESEYPKDFYETCSMIIEEVTGSKYSSYIYDVSSIEEKMKKIFDKGNKNFYIQLLLLSNAIKDNLTKLSDVSSIDRINEIHSDKMEIKVKLTDDEINKSSNGSYLKNESGSSKLTETKVEFFSMLSEMEVVGVGSNFYDEVSTIYGSGEAVHKLTNNHLWKELDSEKKLMLSEVSKYKTKLEDGYLVLEIDNNRTATPSYVNALYEFLDIVNTTTKKDCREKEDLLGDDMYYVDFEVHNFKGGKSREDERNELKEIAMISKELINEAKIDGMSMLETVGYESKPFNIIPRFVFN